MQAAFLTPIRLKLFMGGTDDEVLLANGVNVFENLKFEFLFIYLYYCRFYQGQKPSLHGIIS